MNSQERAKRQSTDEWIEEFSTGQPVTPKQEQSAPYKPWIRDAPAEAVGNLQIIKQRTLAYDTHRTTSSNGHLILIFTDSETGDEVAAFFNVDIRQQRGIGKGQACQSAPKTFHLSASKTFQSSDLFGRRFYGV